MSDEKQMTHRYFVSYKWQYRTDDSAETSGNDGDGDMIFKTSGVVQTEDDLTSIRDAIKKIVIDWTGFPADKVKIVIVNFFLLGLIEQGDPLSN
jgi:hypothetical protein